MWGKFRNFVAKYDEDEANNDCIDGALRLPRSRVTADIPDSGGYGDIEVK